MLGVVLAAIVAATVGSASSMAASAAVPSHPGSSRALSHGHRVRAARRQARRLLRLMPLPAGARRRAREPAGGGAWLAGYAVNIPGWPRMVDLHEFFVVSSTTPRSVIDWMQRHLPPGSSQGDSGADSKSAERWTSFYFQRLRRFAHWPDLVADAVPIAGGKVAVRIDAQVAPHSRHPSGGYGPGGGTY